MHTSDVAQNSFRCVLHLPLFGCNKLTAIGLEILDITPKASNVVSGQWRCSAFGSEWV